MGLGGKGLISPVPSIAARVHRGLSIVILQIASHGLCEEEWEDMMLESQGRLSVIQKIFKWLININKIRERLSGKEEEARFQVRGSICIC